MYGALSSLRRIHFSQALNLYHKDNLWEQWNHITLVFKTNAFESMSDSIQRIFLISQTRRHWSWSAGSAL